jgi:hypothetical protein
MKDYKLEYPQTIHLKYDTIQNAVAGSLIYNLHENKE